LASCSSKSPTDVTLDVGEANLEGNVVSWESSEPAMGAVRYGFSAGHYEHVAYPVAAGRADRQMVTSHSVPLLDLREGEPVYFQVLNDFAGQTVAGVEQTSTATVGPASNLLTSTMIHIGWGDCHLITMPNTGHRLLIDAGDAGAVTAVQSYFAAHGVDDLDVALATHVHADHIGGMVGNGVGVLELFDPEVFLDSPNKIAGRALYASTLDILQKEAIARVVVQRGQTDDDIAALGALDPEVDFLVLNSGLAPDTPLTGYDGTDINNESIALKITYGDVDCIIGGDTEFESEASILSAFDPATLNVEYYKAHHHGRYDGSSAPWLAALKPRVSLVPVTSQEYSDGLQGFLSASQQTLDRIAAVGADVYVIDDLPDMGLPRGSGRNYNITFATDGISYEVRAEWALQPTKHVLSHDCDH
jgi:beta-lactamase superfamily II metal-dependent hydrolase